MLYGFRIAKMHVDCAKDDIEICFVFVVLKDNAKIKRIFRYTLV